MFKIPKNFKHFLQNVKKFPNNEEIRFNILKCQWRSKGNDMLIFQTHISSTHACTYVHKFIHTKTTTNISPRYSVSVHASAKNKRKADARTARTGNIEGKETKIDTQRPGQRRRKLKVCPSIKYVAKSGEEAEYADGWQRKWGRRTSEWGRCALNRPWSSSIEVAERNARIKIRRLSSA